MPFSEVSRHLPHQDFKSVEQKLQNKINVRESVGHYIQEGDRIRKDFHQLFRINPDPRKNRDKHKLRKKADKKNEKDKKGELSQASSKSNPPVIEIPGNASSFGVYAQIRGIVLDNITRQAQNIYLAVTQSQALDSDSECDTDKENVGEIPKIVGIGLVSVYELIRGSVSSYPALCIRALEALLDILQGQQPEALSKEPVEVIDALFDLLLRLATVSNGDVLTCPSSPLVGVACACLLALVVARGDTAKFLRATADIIMTSRQLASQNIQVPIILTVLQRSAHAVLLGKTSRPDWFMCGVPKSALTDQFNVKMVSEGFGEERCAMTCDGHYLYIHSRHGLFKIGSGFGGSIKGHIYLHRPDFYPGKTGWLGFAHGDVLFRLHGGGGDMMVVDKELLKVSEVYQCSDKGWDRGLAFCDGRIIGNIVPDREDGFVIHTYNPQVKPMPLLNQINISLAEKCIQVLGNSNNQSSLNPGLDEDAAFIGSGRDFTLLRTPSGKVYYSGKSAALGMKAGGAQPPPVERFSLSSQSSRLKSSKSSGSRWPELTITKAPRIVHVSVGHDGQHAILVAEDGTAYFVGTSRRGEDGDSNKVRRQPKPVKPKKVVKLEGQHVVTAACNNGTSCLVTRDGELFVFGKDALNCDHSCGMIMELKDYHITSVALGKAHIVVLTNKGHIYTFGMNNKGQCGRDFHNKESGDYDCDEEEAIESGEDAAEWVICAKGKHQWGREHCMVCTICHQCTGYGAGCVSSGRPNRNPGQPCGCGSGESGCIDCGSCHRCADGGDPNGYVLPLVQIEPLGLIPDGGSNLASNHIFSRKNRKSSDSVMEHTDKRRTLQPRNLYSASRKGEEVTSDHDTSKGGGIPPARVQFPHQVSVVQIACGLHHSIALCSNGDVYTWGSNIHGQLGTGDLSSHGSPTLIRLPPTLRVNQIAAGSYHSALLTSNGQIYTFGAYQKGQLGRCAPQYDSGEGSSRGRAPWFSVPGPVPSIGPRMGKRATWIGCSADSTFIKLDQSLINSHNLQAANVVANNSSLILLPVGRKSKVVDDDSWKVLVISRTEGHCRSFTSNDQVDFSGAVVCLDPVYDILYSFDSAHQNISCYNIVAAKSRRLPLLSQTDGLRDVLSSELSLPVMPDFQVSRAQVALHMLASLDTISWAYDNGISVSEDDPHSVSVSRIYSRDDFLPVNRFENHGGGWGYSPHSIEAIRFMCDTDILVGGFGLFGGRGEYLGKIKIYELGAEGGDQENDGELLAETEEVLYECGTKQKYPLLFDEPVSIQSNKWYVAWSRISGPSSDCGSFGQSMVTTEDQVVFYFKSSKKSNNGTDVNAGQIPQILYRVSSSEGLIQSHISVMDDPVPILSKKFFLNVTNESFHSLLELVTWAWTTLCTCISEKMNISATSSPSSHTVAKLDYERLVYICCACLRLLKIYINEIYPNSASPSIKQTQEKACLVECVSNVRTLLRQMLSDPLPMPVQTSKKGKHKASKGPEETSHLSEMMGAVLDECHTTFVACFHAFYPTGQLKWSCLCDLLLSRDEGCVESHESDRLLSAVLASLCSPTVKLRATCPILSDPDSDIPHRASPADNVALSTLQPGDLFRFPMLVEHMTSKTEVCKIPQLQCQMEIDQAIGPNNGVGMMWTFREVLDRLLGVICGGVRQALRGERVAPLPSLVHNTCLLLAASVAELTVETTISDNDVPPGGKVLHTTPCRFTKTSQSRTWSTGNGSPDVVCFITNRPGIIFAGACIYGGVGMYEYEVEILDESGSNTGKEMSHNVERWRTLESAKGTFGPDDMVADIVEIKFERPVPLKEGAKYAIRLSNRGGRTSNGDGGLGNVKGPDGTVFTFSSCNLSVNGTNQVRGQIPHILYYSAPQDTENHLSTKEIAQNQARRSVLTMVGSILRSSTELIIMGLGVGDEIAVDVLGSAPILGLLLPLILAHIKSVAVSDPRSAVSVLGLIQEILPQVSALNNLGLATQRTAVTETLEECHTTTSHHYIWVESEHPYRPATVSNYRVYFPLSVEWMALEFDPQCGTCQEDDSLQIYIPNFDCNPRGLEGTRKNDPSRKDNKPFIQTCLNADVPPYWSVLNRFSSSQNWPKQTVVLPGNQLIFSFETASNYVKDEKANTFGFRVLIVGYEWPPNPPDSLRHLEKELSFLGGLCAASLIKKDLLMPPIPGEEPEEDMEMVEDISRLIYQMHPALLSKGFALSHPPTIHQTLDGVIPFSCHSNERLFLRDFVSCNGATSGGRLAKWLQPDSHVDTRTCEVLFSKDDIRAGWPAIITIITRDQYNEVVHAANMKIEVLAVPMNIGDEIFKMRRFSQQVPDNMTFGGLPPPSLDIPYQPYDNYSFEELRYISPNLRRPTETMLVRSNNDGSYSCNWTPGCTGWYSLNVKIDGFQVDKHHRLEVKEPPPGMAAPSHNHTRHPTQQPSRLRKFVMQNSAGLRVRMHPCLQSEQIGIIRANGTIAFVDEVHNSDGIWLRLSPESVRQYSTVEDINEAWCLQYNQHLGKTLLIPLDQPKTILDQVINDTISRRGPLYPGPSGAARTGITSQNSSYTVIKCGASGHNIRSKPNLKAPPVGMLILGNTFTVDSQMKNGEGTWVRLDSDSTRKYCFTDGEAWSLAFSKGHTLYLQCSNGTMQEFIPEAKFGDGQPSGFDFSLSPNNAVFKPFQSPSAVGKSPFVFGSAIGCSKVSQDEKVVAIPKENKKIIEHEEMSKDKHMQEAQSSHPSMLSSFEEEKEGHSQGKFSLLNRLLKDDLPAKKPSSPPIQRKKANASLLAACKDIPPELHGVSVKELVKAIGESRANGNGATPPRTPPPTPKRLSRSSSPRAPPASSSPRQSTRSSSPVPIPGRERGSSNSSPLQSSRCQSLASLDEAAPSEQRFSPPAAGTASVNESLSDTSAVASSLPQDVSPSPSISSQLTSAASTPRKQKATESLGTSPKSVTQTATQTSPEGLKFSIGTTPPKDDISRLSPKNSRRERGCKPHRTKRDRPLSPTAASSHEKVKEALSPTAAECLRAVFAAFLWHEGIVHDAMACASYLKFHPELTKKGTLLWKLCQPQQPAKPEVKLTKEQKARQRHSVEVSAYSYLNVTVQNTEDLWKLGSNANIIDVPKISTCKDESGNDVINKKSSESGSFLQGSLQGYKLATVMEGPSGQEIAELPLVLRHVVLLWEELTTTCLKAISQQMILSSPTSASRMKRPERSSREKPEKERRKSKKKFSGSAKINIDAGAEADDDNPGHCELCGQLLPFDSPQHYASNHPGCGGPSHGCGYVGTKWKFFPSKDRLPFTCGDAFKDCYHMCWSCRNKYRGNVPPILPSKDSNVKKSKRKTGARMPSPMPNADTHVIMRNNAMFLLDLASSASNTLITRTHIPRRSPCNMPCVSELSPDGSPFPKIDFQCLHMLNCQQQHLNQLREDMLLQHNLQNSDTTTATPTNGYYSSSGDSKETTKESINYSPGGASHQESPASDQEIPWNRPFHRSVSVTIGQPGQDWSSLTSVSHTEGAIQKAGGVVMRKRNNSSSENPGTGVSSLLAHPSLALEKLASQMTRVGGPNDPSGRARQVIIRPIMAFIFQNHDLETLAFAMRHATRKAAARVFGMQALNWLIRSVSQPTCLHDLLWCFVCALTPPSLSMTPLGLSGEDQKQGNLPLKDKLHDSDGEMVVLEHPISDVTLAGDAVHPLPVMFHQLLQTVADLMMLLPPGSPLQMMAVRCWGLRFMSSDHDFLHQSHVFSNISKILSRSEEVLGGGDEASNSMYESHGGPNSCQVNVLQDLTGDCEIKVSSRSAMIASLIDSSTETFWESGEEDRNKTKAITLLCPASVQPHVVYVHIDNCRDLGNKVSNVIFKFGSNSEEIFLLRQTDVESRFTGWVHSSLPITEQGGNQVVLELRGPDQSVRVRQVRLLGHDTSVQGNSHKLCRQVSALTLQHRACEQETLKVFRLLTGMVFGKLLSGSARNEDASEGEPEEGLGSPLEAAEDEEHNNDLREHMVGILFSRSKLTHLQKQVCAHIVQAIKKEAKRAREEWEASLVSNMGLGVMQGVPVTPDEGQSHQQHHALPDTYCFEMLSMVLALSGSAVGRAHLAHQEQLLKYLLSLLHSGSARVQRQVVSLFRRMLVDISPTILAQVLGVQELPSLDLTLIMPAQEPEEITFEYKLGILDVFLAIIAKGLTVQVKNKTDGSKPRSPEQACGGKGVVTSVTLASGMPKPQSNSPQWWLKGNSTRKLVDLIISLIRDMCEGKISESWAQVSKGAIAENILNLTRIGEQDRTSAAACLATPTVWLALASLCVLHPDHIEALSSRQWRATASAFPDSNAQPQLRPICENHDDGETFAMILCNSCGNLCGECDRILHLHRRTRAHHRVVFREEQQAIKVDLHEGCGRAKLFWLLVLADSTTLKAMIELRGESNRSRGSLSSTSSCRFCGSPAQSSLLSPIPVCQDPDCQDYSRDACLRTLDCNHVCGGIRGETKCLPCLQGCSDNPSLKQDADDMCMICFSEALSAAPAIQLECGHVFHVHCCRSVLVKRWPGPRINFTFSLCPICKVSLKHWSLSELLEPTQALYDDVRRKALMRLEYEGLLKAEAIMSPGARYYNEPASYAMDRYAYYVCFKCSKAYYGGEVRCEAEAGQSDDYDPRELVCGACSDVSRAQMCPKHGTDFLEYKCRYCCSVAVFFCFGTTHFCNACHEDFQRVTTLTKSELPKCPAGPRSQQLPGEECPLHVQHPPTGEEFALGCGVCRNAHTF